jgi:hypothetical protein
MLKSVPVKSDSYYRLVSVIDLSSHSTPSALVLNEQSACQMVEDMAKRSFIKIIGELAGMVYKMFLSGYWLDKKFLARI